MTNEELRNIIADTVCDEDQLNHIIILDGDEFADGAIGLTINNEVVYSYDKLVRSLMDHWNVSETDAIEFIEYNTVRSLPYMKSHGNPPVILREFFD